MSHNRTEKVIPLSPAARRYLETKSTAEMLEAIQKARYDRRLDRIGATWDKPPPRRFHQAEGGARVDAGRATIIPPPAVPVSRPWWRRVLDVALGRAG